MSDPPADAARPAPPASGGGWLRPVILALSCLVIGFVGGWILRGGGGGATALPPADNGTTTEGTQTAPVTTQARPQPPPAPARAGVTLVILNGTSVTGLAARTKTQAEGLGYTNVGIGNAADDGSPTTAYFRAGARAAARQAATDLGARRVQPLPAGSQIEAAALEALPDAEVVVVLGSG